MKHLIEALLVRDVPLFVCNEMFLLPRTFRLAPPPDNVHLTKDRSFLEAVHFSKAPTMNPLSIPVPPHLEQAVGWSGGPARWLSLAWTCCGDCPWMEDGRTSMTGTAWGLLAWTRHSIVAPVLRNIDLGSSERDGKQRLVLDRLERRVFVANTAEARAFVREQWPAEEPLELSPEQWKAVLEHVRQEMLNRPLPTMEQLMKQMKDHSHVVGEMVRWLDEQTAKLREEVEGGSP